MLHLDDNNAWKPDVTQTGKAQQEQERETASGQRCERKKGSSTKCAQGE